VAGESWVTHWGLGRSVDGERGGVGVLDDSKGLGADGFCAMGSVGGGNKVGGYGGRGDCREGEQVDVDVMFHTLWFLPTQLGPRSAHTQTLTHTIGWAGRLVGDGLGSH